MNYKYKTSCPTEKCNFIYPHRRRSIRLWRAGDCILEALVTVNDCSSAGWTSKWCCCRAGTRERCDVDETLSVPAFSWTRHRLYVFPNSISAHSVSVERIYSASRAKSLCFVCGRNRQLFPRGWTGHCLKLTTYIQPLSRTKLSTFTSVSPYVIECIITLCVTLWRPGEVREAVAWRKKGITFFYKVPTLYYENERKRMITLELWQHRFEIRAAGLWFVVDGKAN